MATPLCWLFSFIFLLDLCEAQIPQQNGGGQATNFVQGPPSPCGSLSREECDLQATAHNLYGFNLPYLSDGPVSYPKYPSNAWLDPECNIKKCPHTEPRDPLAGIENMTESQWSTECRNVKMAVNCAATMATKCLPEYFVERKEFILDTQHYYDAICDAPNLYPKLMALGQCSQAVMLSPSGTAFKICHETWLASMHKSAMARGPNLASRWTSGTVNRDHCCQIKQRQNCLMQGNAQTICGLQAVQDIQTIFDTTYTAFHCNDKLTQCPR